MIARSFPALLQSFFTERLFRQRHASGRHTIAGYRDAFRLLLRYAAGRLGTTPSKLWLDDLDASFIGQFLDHLEHERGNSARTRNARLAAIHSFFQYVALEEPAHALLCQRVLAMPNKRHERWLIEFLHREEIDALIAAPDPSTWIGRRDRTFLIVAVQTGLRVSELIGLRCQDVVLGTGAHVTCVGKGRKQRATPLSEEAEAMLGSWLQERSGLPQEPVFPSSRGGPLSRDAIERLVAKHASKARQSCPSLRRKKVTAHVLRHSAAMVLAMLYNTGARVSEMIGVHVGDVVLDASPCVHLRGKGRKRRSVPLWTSTVQAIRAWLRRNPSLGEDAPLLPNRNGRTMTRSNVNKRLDIAVARAAEVHPNLAKRHISPHSAPLDSHAYAAVRRGLQCDRALAGP